MTTHETERAIMALFRHSEDGMNDWVNGYNEAIEDALAAIEALEQEPSCRNPRHVDLISRKDVIDGLEYEKEMSNRALDNMDVVGQEREKFAWSLELVECFIEDIKKLPSVEPKCGKWIGAAEYCEYLEKETGEQYQPSGMGNPVYCDQCWSGTIKKFDFCPNCGADMRGDKE